jgi:hypothetical protein
VGQVGAGDQQDEPGRRHQQRERFAVIGSQPRDAACARRERDPGPRDRLLPVLRGLWTRVRTQVLRERDVHLRLSLLERPARREARHEVQPVHVAVGKVVVAPLDARLEMKGQPEVGRAPHAQAEEGPRHHPHDRDRDAVQRHPATHRGAAGAEVLLPVAVTDDGGRIRPLTIVLGSEGPPEERLLVQDAEEVPADQVAARERDLVLAFLPHAKAILAAAERRDPFEGGDVPGKMPVRGERVAFPHVGPWAARARPFRRRVREQHETRRVLERQGLQQDRIDGRKDRRRGTDAERHGQHRDRREAGPLAEDPRAVCQVLPEIAHGTLPMTARRQGKRRAFAIGWKMRPRRPAWPACCPVAGLRVPRSRGACESRGRVVHRNRKAAECGHRR